MTQHDAQILHYAVGGSLPVRQSLLTSGEFAKSLAPWEDINVYLEAAKDDKPLRIAPTHLDIQAAFTAEYDLVLLGTESYKDAAAKFVPKIDALLKKAKQDYGG
jgi:ABC-type glycerol-3-phosphate transport system substrate-binding protein